MNIIIRVDASILIGSGHVMRCLTLADGLAKVGVKRIEFICRELSGNLIDLIEKYYPVHRLSSDSNARQPENYSNDYSRWLEVSIKQDIADTQAVLKDKSCDLLVIDHYALDITWEKALRFFCEKIMVIDDIANRRHDCDLLLDQNFYLNMEQRYRNLVPKRCRQLLGPEYVLLRPEFREIRKKRLAAGKDKIKKIKNILIFMGGTDPDNITLKILQNFPDDTEYQGKVNVVVGQSNPYQLDVENFCKLDERMVYHCQPSYYNELLVEADLAIGAGGSSSWERCYIGLPAVIYCLAENQKEICVGLASQQVIKYLGQSDEYANFKSQLLEILMDLRFIKLTTVKCWDFVDGKGLERVCNYAF